MTESKNDYLIFAVFSSVWVFLGWVAYLLALSGFFYSWIFGGFFLLLLLVAGRQMVLKKISLNISREFIIISSSVLIFACLSSFFVTPTIFTGRDQGSISEAAIRLSQNHKLEFSTPASTEFFKIYGAGKALNFPGFYYNTNGQLTTQFPIAYISWLAVFYSFFGLIGLIVANAVLLSIFLISFYLLARLFVSIRFSSILLTLAATSFPIFWFFKFTLSENMALALLWLSALWLTLFIKEKRLFFYFSFLISAGLLVFTRIEGIFFLLAGLTVIFFFTKGNELWKGKRKILLLYPAAFLGILLLLNFTKDIYFYKEIAKAVLGFGNNDGGNISFAQKFLSPMLMETKLFFLYGIADAVILGIFGIIYFTIRKNREILIPFFVTVPSFVYLINSWISSDHPWMLRRFVFSIVPVFIFYSVTFLAKWFEEKDLFSLKFISYLVFASMLAFNLILFVEYFPVSENKKLLAETEKISTNFSSTDLVLIDRYSSYDPFSMIGGPMSFIYGKNSVYFFNLEDLKKIDREKFSGIYIIAPDGNAENYINSIGKENISSTKSYSIKNEKLFNLEMKDDDPILPIKKEYEATGKILMIR